MHARTAEEIYNDALDLPVDEQRAYVARECAHDPDLEREVLELLAVAADHPDLLSPLHPDARDIPKHLGKYRIVQEIGRGAMGRVFLADDPDLHRRVAIKLLPEHLANSQGVKWLRREAAILSQMEHPRIAILYSIEESDGFHFMTMQYVAGQTLAERLQAGPLPVTEALRVCLHVAEALTRAHAKGIIHRDLKPLNIMITEDGSAKVLDFGIAMVKEFPVPASAGESADQPLGNTGASRFLGTPDYMSPEQLTGEAIDHRTDIWALGSILYECLTGRPACQRAPDHPSGLQRFPDWTSLPKKLSPGVRRLLRRCLAENRSERPATAEEVREVLEAEWQAACTSRRSVRRFLPYLAGASGILALAAIALQLLSPTANPPFDRAEWEGKHPDFSLVGKDPAGEELWRLSSIAGDFLSPPQRRLRHSIDPPLLRTADGEQVLAVASASSVGDDRIHGINAQTGKVLWSRTPVAQLPRVEHEGRWTRLWQESILGGPDGEDLFLFCWSEGVHYPCALEFCRADGSVIATYYHPGMIYLWSQTDADQGGRPELLFYGSNNGALRILDGIPSEAQERGYYPSALFILEGPIDGQGYPALDWPGIPRAEEQAYLLIPPYSGNKQSDLEALSCSDDMRILASLTDDRRLFLAPGLRPTHYVVALWSESWREMEDRVQSLPVYRVSGGDAVRLDVPVNPSSEEKAEFDPSQ